MTPEETIQKIQRALSWYRSCAGQVSHADKEDALIQINKIVRKYELANEQPIEPRPQKSFHDDF